MKLIIAEKKELAEAIVAAIPGDKKYNGNSITVGDYITCWIYGHILTHKEPEEVDPSLKKWTLESLPIYFPKWDKKPLSNKIELFNTVKELICSNQVTEIIHAGDADSEGQYLVDEVLEYCSNKKPVKRLMVNDNTLGGVQKAFSKIDDNSKYISLGKSAEARAIADMIVGFSLSRYYSIINNAKLSVGRVQTPTMALVVNRDNEIKNHIKEKYYNLHLKTNINNIDIDLKYYTKEKTTDKSIHEEFINKIENRTSNLVVTKKESYRATPLPYNLSDLESDAATLFKYSAKKTMDITQSLRDKHKAITYNRSDCRYLSEEHFKEASKLIPIVAQKLKFIATFNFTEKSRCFNDKYVTAHHGIIPTGDGNFEDFSQEEKNIYKLIAERYFIQFLEKVKVEKTEARTEIGEVIFKKGSTKILEPGYTKYFKVLDDEDIENEEEIESKKEDDLCKILAGEYQIEVGQSNFFIEEKETVAKKPYTEATLIKDLNSIAKYVKDPEIRELLKSKDKDKKDVNGSIGTTATIPGILEGLIEKGFLTRKEEKIVSTELAKEYLKILPESLKTPDVTALWWSIQEKIARGEAKVEDLTLSVLEDVKSIINSEHKTISSEFSRQKQEKEVIGKCPKCGNPIYEGEKNFYCSGYKTGCDFKLWKKVKVFNQKEVTITKQDAKTLLNKGKILITGLTNKAGKKYKANFKLEVSDKYVNLSLDSFVN
ncbi:type IA DNA topoisomerase [Fusobacterium polymorphum]|uniref:DNA topoisomerase n=1 Tax=Fusobacterium nucleatum subsp. polymorphum TaxID=76857 RepID=A0A2C6BBB5_FUSNP|nr:type IA DNA topoisomerase [Fusobacterium polymorphum]PHI03786.1 DNA topoisomerase [Fusobacterium polymorphum]PHI16131.1 DNA topoisomerase [Fusobacterium polymorphum]